jgi:hypothetical protein
MSAPSIKKTIPDRAIASVAFACFAILVRRVFSSLEWLPIEAGAGHFDIPDKFYIPIIVSLQTGFRGLAVAALVWCIWSWCKEWWLPASLATLLTALALFDVFLVR